MSTSTGVNNHIGSKEEANTHHVPNTFLRVVSVACAGFFFNVKCLPFYLAATDLIFKAEKSVVYLCVYTLSCLWDGTMF